MYRNFIIAFIITVFAGCSAPEPKQLPTWYTNPPKDYRLFYAVASAKDKIKAKNLAIISLRNSINKDMDKFVKSHNFEDSLKSNSHFCKKLSLRGIKIEKLEIFKGDTLILLSIPKKQIFNKVKLTSDENLQNLKQHYSASKNLIKIKKYIYIKPLMKNYLPLVSATACKSICISTYDFTTDLEILKDLKKEYNDLLSSVKFYILSDGNSRIYTNILKDAIMKEGFSISNNMKDENTLRVIITSKTTNSKEYTFNISKNLVKFTTLDARKNKIAFRQHTFIGKSRKSHQDAKQQTKLSLNYKIKKLGIFNFIGLENK